MKPKSKNRAIWSCGLVVWCDKVKLVATLIGLIPVMSWSIKKGFGLYSTCICLQCLARWIISNYCNVLPGEIYSVLWAHAEVSRSKERRDHSLTVKKCLVHRVNYMFNKYGEVFVVYVNVSVIPWLVLSSAVIKLLVLIKVNIRMLISLRIVMLV